LWGCWEVTWSTNRENSWTILTLPHSFTEEIEKIMGQVGNTLNEYLWIELPNSSEIQEPGNMLPNEEMSYNKEE
jgi:hypothetical protein